YVGQINDLHNERNPPVVSYSRMPPKSKSSRTNTLKDDKKQTKISTPIKKFSESSKWPSFLLKSDLQLQTLLENQIVVIPSFLTHQECTNLINFIEKNIPLEQTVPNKGEAFRNNDRFSIENPKFAESLYQSGLNSLVSHWKSFVSTKKSVVGLNSNIRIYKYSTGQQFGQHYDDFAKDSLGRMSEWTLLIYLNGGHNEVDVPLSGGETVFYKAKRGEIVVAPERGMALLHKHGHDCLLHEAKEVKRGNKYVLRSDLMFA
ncbi:17326_t:CDS:2, partial [Acaulospora morrowiae]